MKKILALLLAVSMVFALAACGNNEGAKKEDAPTGVKMNLETLPTSGIDYVLKTEFYSDYNRHNRCNQHRCYGRLCQRSSSMVQLKSKYHKCCNRRKCYIHRQLCLCESGKGCFGDYPIQNHRYRQLRIPGLFIPGNRPLQCNKM